jgi:hypothetical protein
MAEHVFAWMFGGKARLRLHIKPSKGGDGAFSRLRGACLDLTAQSGTIAVLALRVDGTTAGFQIGM